MTLSMLRSSGHALCPLPYTPGVQRGADHLPLVQVPVSGLPLDITPSVISGDMSGGTSCLGFALDGYFHV